MLRTHIHEDYGEDGLRNALVALALHLEYYKGKGGRLKKIRNIQSKHKELIDYSAVTIFPEERNAWWEPFLSSTVVATRLD